MVFYIHDQGSRIHTPVDALLRRGGVAPTEPSARVRPVQAHDDVAAAEALDAYADQQAPAQRRLALSAADVMSAPARFAAPGWSLQRAWAECTASRIHHLPVLDNTGELVGIVSDRDLLRASAHTAASTARTVADIMTRRVVSCAPATGLRLLAEVMVGQRIGAVPVLDNDGALAGIVSRSDILKSLMRDAPLETWV
ncbi:MAG TPA: CBS domain-containing protein [Spongiibacteraceae bacterium]|nr:CBS domain-containing protein [Spongiibacteraceae bacterium]